MFYYQKYLSKKGWIIAILLIAIGGAIFLPYQAKLQKKLSEANLSHQIPTLELRKKMSQMSYIAIFGGFRSLISSFLYIKAYIAWENVEWTKLEKFFSIICELQPKNAFYWENASWYLAFNASAYYESHSAIYPSLRQHYAENYVQKGINFLENGIKHLPNNFKLNEAIGLIYDRKKNDPCSSFPYYKRASQCENAPSYLKRLALYRFDDCLRSSNPLQTYFALINLYLENEKNHVPTLISKIQELEIILKIPKSFRIKEKKIPPYRLFKQYDYTREFPIL